MRFLFFALLLSLFITSSANAQTAADDKTPGAAASNTGLPRASFIQDEKNGAIIFLIDNQEVVRIDAQGIHVRGDLEYTGATRHTEQPESGGADAP